MIRVGIVDDHAILRLGLSDFLSKQADLCVVGEAASGNAAIDLVHTTAMDVLLLDLSMPGKSGTDVLATIHAGAPDMGILVLSAYPEEYFSTNLLLQGVRGYLNKMCAPEEIITALRVVAQGKRYISARTAELLVQQLNRKHEGPAHEQLSKREFQVFLGLARGLTVGEVAQALSLSVKTVSTYRTRLMEKIGLRSNNDLTYYALKNHLIE
jgi:DNA-binding NarL/FixJ family response regulator